jgi:hypothetical protein
MTDLFTVSGKFELLWQSFKKGDYVLTDRGDVISSLLEGLGMGGYLSALWPLSLVIVKLEWYQNGPSFQYNPSQRILGDK